ncbi:MAG: T9SS type A sorting domain-containing protein [Bacteroidia bacterium]|nr:T9SS type A sorting domain-containing protein [Bacteroidia bacterium]
MEEITLYPNPSSGIFQLIAPDLKIEKISVFDLRGREILTHDKPILDLSPYQNGIYFIKIESNLGASIKKVRLAK